MVKAKEIPDGVELERETDAIRCDCGGYAEEVPCTDDERREYGCGRPWDCCSAAFVCTICGTRYAGHKPAPEME